ncbi:MAG: hypothetical protein V3U51_02005 [Thermoplasmata archaeon]
MDDEGGVSGESEETVTIRQEITMDDMMGRKSPGWRIPLSIVTAVGWLVFLVIWLFFYAGDHHIYQNIGIVLFSLMVVALILGTAWIAWGLSGMNEFEEMIMATGGLKSRMIFSMAVPIVILMLLGLWLFFMAMDFDIYQNIAVFIVIVLVMGGILGVVWTTGGWSQGG